MVIQLEDMDPSVLSTPREIQQAVATYEGVVDYLDKMGMIDCDRVGIIGFSRTCHYVKYALTHSKYQFAAASVADGIDGGYYPYILVAAVSPEAVIDQEGLNGGAPFGPGLKSWLEKSPGFNN